MGKAENIEAVQRMQDHIDANIQHVITMSELAAAAGYSQWHAARVFKELTGKAPFDYIRSLRLSKAAIELRDREKKVVDVAFDFVFDSHEGFTRAFTGNFGVAPKKYSEKPGPIPLFMPYKVRSVYLNPFKGEEEMSEEKKTNTVFVQIVERPSRKAVIRRGVKAKHYFEYCEETGCDVWGVLCSIREAIYEPAGMWLPAKMIKPGTSEYVQGVEVPEDYDMEVPEGFEIIDLPPCRLMVFQGEPYEDGHFEEAIGGLWEAIDKYNPEIYGYEWAKEDAPRIQLEPRGYRGYIEARPVRPVNEGI